MDSTTRLTIELPQDLADAVRARVTSGAFANESEVVAEGLRRLKEQDQSVEDWLREEVVPAIDEWKSGKVQALSIDDVLDELDRHRARRSAAE